MGNNSIMQELSGENIRSDQDQGWEKEIYQEVCQEGQLRAIKRLEKLEEKLFLEHPVSWKVIGFRERTLVARFGEIRIRRKLYQDERDDYHFLLDEHLKFLPYQLATPDLQVCIVELCAQGTFRPSEQTLENLTAGVLTVATLCRLVEKTANRAIEQEAADYEAMFERGDLPLEGDVRYRYFFVKGMEPGFIYNRRSRSIMRSKLGSPMKGGIGFPVKRNAMLW